MLEQVSHCNEVLCLYQCSSASMWLLSLLAVPSTPMPTLTHESSSCLMGAMPAADEVSQCNEVLELYAQLSHHVAAVLLAMQSTLMPTLTPEFSRHLTGAMPAGVEIVQS